MLYEHTISGFSSPLIRTMTGISSEMSMDWGRPKKMKTVSVQQLLSLEAPPSPLSSRPRRSAVERSAVRRLLLGSVFRQRDLGLRPTEADETASVQQPLSPGSTALPFVISTEAYPDFLLRGTYQGYGCGFP
jgi:hypothetical protein